MDTEINICPTNKWRAGINRDGLYKEKGSYAKRGWEKWPETRASQPTSRRKTPGVTTTQPCMNTTENPPPGDQGLAFQTHALQMILYGPFYMRIQPCCGLTRIVSLQLVFGNIRKNELKENFLW